MIKQQLARFNRLELLGNATALEKLERLSAWLGRDVYVKRDDTTPLALGGNKLRKLEYLAADALAAGADTLITAGAIQSNHVRQTAALAAKLGLGCVALLENPIGTQDNNYLANGNRLLLDLFDAKVELVDNLDNADDQLHALAERLRSNGKKTLSGANWRLQRAGGFGLCPGRPGTGRADQGQRPEIRRRGAGLRQCRDP
jgi:D-cysteine desulfhydrase